MFGKLFAERGLSLDRLKALLEVGVAGSIVKAADGDPVRQSQYSRQIKELEDFFRTKLIERQGKGTRLTPNGKELARISRFFMLGLSNFRRGSLAEDQTFKVGASATFIRQFLLPVVSRARTSGLRFATEIAGDEEIERRLHDLTLDFGVVGHADLSRPLQTQALGGWRLELWAPRSLCPSEIGAARAFREQRLPLAFARKELERFGVLSSADEEAYLVCDNFLEARAALDGQGIAALLPDFLAPGKVSGAFVRIRIPGIDSRTFRFYLAWNPRLLRLNPHAIRMRDSLAKSLGGQMAKQNRRLLVRDLTNPPQPTAGAIEAE